MAAVANQKSKEASNQGIKSTRKIEWIKATFSTNIANDTITYVLTEIKTVSAIVGAPWSWTFNSSTKTIVITLPHAIAAGSVLIGIVE